MDLHGTQGCDRTSREDGANNPVSAGNFFKPRFHDAF